MQWLFHDPRVTAYYIITALSPLIGWLIALYITRTHFEAKARLRRQLQWLVLAYYGALFAVILTRPGMWSSWWTVHSLAMAAVFAYGLSVAGLFIKRAQKIARTDFSEFCPKCGYSLLYGPVARCPECGYTAP